MAWRSAAPAHIFGPAVYDIQVSKSMSFSRSHHHRGAAIPLQPSRRRTPGHDPEADATGTAAAGRAVAAVLAIILGAAAQWLFERTRFSAEPPPPPGIALFAVAALLAVWSTWKRGRFDPATDGFRVIVPDRWWLAALVPGAGCLLAAAVIHAMAAAGAHQPLITKLWIGGVMLLLAAGLAQLMATRGRERFGWGGGWSPRRVLVWGLAIVALSLVMRLVMGVTGHPVMVENDEAFIGLAARDILGDRPFAWFELFWVGVPNLSLVFTRAAQILFGADLWGIRIGNAVLGGLSVACVFGFGRRLVGDFPALMAALLVATAHVHIHWSRNGQHFILTAIGAAVVLWMLSRAWTGGSLLSWVGTGVALGAFAQTYQASYLLPPLVLLTGAGWALFCRLPRRSAAASMAVIQIIALLMLAPVAISLARQWTQSLDRPSRLSVFNRENQEQLMHWYGVDSLSKMAAVHVERSALVFNFGDDFHQRARRSLVDPVTAALLPLAAAMLLIRIRSPLGWLFWTWIPLYLVIGVLLCAHPPTNHRVVTVLLMSSLAVSWGAHELAGTIRDGFALPRWSSAALVGAFVVTASWMNIEYYFVEFRASRPMGHTEGFTWLACSYAGSYTILDATWIDGWQYVPPNSNFFDYQCPSAHRVRIRDSADLWRLDRFTEATRLVLIVPREVVLRHPGEPEGYRVVRRYVDRSIKGPVPLPLEVYELERVDAPSSR